MAAKSKRPSKKKQQGPRQNQQRHQERLRERELRERARERRDARQRVVRIVATVAVVAIVAALGVSLLDRGDDSESVAAIEQAGCQVDSESDDDAGTGRNHREGVAYEVDPPAGGDHSPTALPPGRYRADDAPDGQVVHSMEHGYVIIWHRPDLPTADMDAILDTQSRFDRDVLVVERPSLSVPVAATAWHKRALCTDVNASALAEFVSAYRNQGPEKVPH